MPEPKKYRLEDYGLTPEMVLDIPKPYEPNRFELQQFTGQAPVSPKYDSFAPIRQIISQNPNYKGLYQQSPELNTQGNIDYPGSTKEKDLTYGQRGLNQINNLLLGLNLQSSGIGDFAREAGAGIASGVERTKDAVLGKNDATGVDLALGIGSTAFGALMTPFAAIKLGTEKVGGRTAGKIAEIGSLLVAGGVPLVAGYFAAEGSTELADKVTNGMDLTPKEKERVLEATGLLSFILGHRVAGKTINATNKKLQLKVEKYLDEILPDQKGLKTITMNEVRQAVNKNLLDQDANKVLKNQKEYVKGEKIEKPDIRGENVLTPEQINKITNPEVKPIESLLKPTESKTPQRDLLNSNKDAIKQILDDDPSLSGNTRAISKKLTSLVEKGELKKKVSLQTIKEIKDEWVKSRPKPKTQEVKTVETPLDEIKLPNFYGKNTSPTVGDILKQYPEFRPLVEGMKDWREISNTLFKVVQDKRPNKLTRDYQNFKELLAEENSQNITDFVESKLSKEEFKKLGKEIDKDFEKGIDPEARLVAEAQKIIEAKNEGTGRVIPEDIANKVLKEKYGEGNKLFTKEKKDAALKILLEKEKTAKGNPFADYERAKALFDIAGYHIESGARTFAQFSQKMVDELGETIKPYLKDLWDDFSKKVKVDDTKIKDWIDKNKSQFNLTLEKIEGKIIDPNTGLEGAARNVSKKEGSVIQYNDNTKGSTWYHELSHTIYNKLRRVNPEALSKYKDDIKTLIGKSDKPFSEQFADAFERMYTDINAPKTSLFKIIQSEFDIPRSFDLRFHNPAKLGFQKSAPREPGKRVEKTQDWLETKYDAPTEVGKEVFNIRQKEEYKKLRDDGTQTFKDAVIEADKYQDITEANLLQLDPRTLNNKIFNKAQQIRIDQIALNKALKIAELRKNYGMQLSTAEAKTLNSELTELMQLQALAKNNLREAARVLESAKKIHRMSPQEYELIQEVAAELGRVKDFKSAEKITDATLKDKAMFWWYNSILSNPLTDVANIIGNATNLVFEIVRQPQVLLNGSALRGLIEGYKNAKRVWDGEQAAISKYTDRAMQLNTILKTKTKTGTRIKNTLLPTSRLAIEDALFRSIFESMRETSQAKMTAKELGVSAKEITDIYTDILEKGTSRNRLVTELGIARFEKEVDAIERYANKSVFQKELGGAGKNIQKALNYPIMLPVKMLALPFLRIAINLSKVSAEASPFGLLKPLLKSAEYKDLTRLEKQDIYSRAIAGTVFYTGLLALMANENVEITGESPEDKNIRDLWYKDGYEPYSIIINKDGKRTVIPYQNVSPINIVLGGIGTMLTDAKYKKDDDTGSVMDKAIKGVLGFVKAIGNQSFLQGTSQLLTAIERTNEKSIKNSIVRMTTPNLFSLFQGQADFGEGKNIYQTESLIEQYKSRLGITGDLKTKPDVFGEDLRSTYRRFPIPKEREINQIADFLLRTGNTIGDPQNPKMQGKAIYTDEQYNEYKRYYRRNVYKLLNEQFSIFKELEKQEEAGDLVIPKLITNLKEIAKILAKQTIEEKK